MRKVAAGAVILLGLLAALGAAKSRPYVSPGFAKSGATYAAGGAASGWDTVSTLFTMSSTMTHELADYNTAKAAADVVYEWVRDDTTFTYALPDTYHVNGSAAGPSYWPTDAVQMTYLKIQPMKYSGTKRLWTTTDSVGVKAPIRPLLVRFDTKVPAGSTVVSASLNFETRAWYCDVGDTVIATLMTNPNDSAWWHHRGVWDAATFAGSTDKATRMARCSYTYQVQQFGSGPDYSYGYKEATSAPWTPPLSQRTYTWDYGSVSDWTVMPAYNAAGISFTKFPIDITNCVQAIAAGAVNNGIAIHVRKSKQGADSNYPNVLLYTFESVDSTVRTRRPWAEIKYITKKYRGEFPGGHDWAFLFHQPDAIPASADSLMIVLDEFNAKTTFDMSYFYIGNGTYVDWPRLLNWLDQGHELAYHTYQHNSYVDYAITDTTSAGWALLKNQLKPGPMFAKAIELGRPDLLSNGNFMRTLSPTAGGYDPFGVLAGRLLGYENNIRWGPTTNVSGDNIAASTNRLGGAWARSAVCDTSRGGASGIKTRYSRPMDLLALTMHIDQIVGAETNKGMTEAQVKFNFRKLVRQVRADGRRVIYLYTHGTKTSSSASTKLIDPEELRWLLEVVDEENGISMTIADYMRWVKSGAVAVDSPNRAAVPDTFETTASQRAWFKPDGIDKRWIRGVR